MSENGIYRTFQDAAEWWQPIPLSPMLLLQPTWIPPSRSLHPMRRTLNPWLALWRFEP